MKYGIMQGRLLPKYKGQYQAFPKDNWSDEFSIASNIGLDFIEFIFDYEDFSLNPLMTADGRSKIIRFCQSSNIKVKSVCADYFMVDPIHSDDVTQSKKSINILIELINSCHELGIKDIVIPCVDQASIQLDKLKNNFVRNIDRPLKLAEKYGINLALELDLAPKSILNLINEFNSNRITINYDLGNSASLGYDVEEEFATYGDKITDLHIKDRSLGGGPVLLGKGNANFKNFFIFIKKYKVNPNILIFQALRDADGVDIFKKQFKWYKEQQATSS